ncbi:hypothetical protein FQN50_005252 [Emmonsiellopsis sp. PD_5]|nr:hypothetical protein FQN50_005252 [Emmonsiellopsis sp. PD_5]
MQELIDDFFIKHLSLTPTDAVMLHQKYYKEYGLAIEGLSRHHKIDPLEFNRAVDDALPLDSILKPDPQLRSLLEDFDTSKVKLWLFTNAYVTHARRVVKLLGVEDLFEGVTYCDYAAAERLVCKPHRDMFEKAEREAGAGAQRDGGCFFVDDSGLNCTHAQARGWETVHFVEPHVAPPQEPASKYQIRRLEELRELFPQFFKSKGA